MDLFEKIEQSKGDFDNLKKIYDKIDNKNKVAKRFAAVELYIAEQSSERGLQQSIKNDYTY